MSDQSRRNFLKTAGIAAAVSSLPFKNLFADAEPQGNVKSRVPFAFGIASYTFRAFTLDQTIAMTKRLGVKRLTLKDMHLPMNSTDEEIKAVLENIRNAGLELSSCGVIYMKTEEDVHHAYAYAKTAGLKMMVGVPDQQVLELAERKTRETDISLAIHNHGPTDQRFPSPESAYKLIRNTDKRMGLCVDVGHTQRLGLDPSVEIERYFDRVFDIHIKDVSSADANGTTVEIGRGVVDTPKLIRTLIRLKYDRTIHFEYEKDESDPLPGVAESIGYVRGILSK